METSRRELLGAGFGAMVLGVAGCGTSGNDTADTANKDTGSSTEELDGDAKTSTLTISLSSYPSLKKVDGQAYVKSTVGKLIVVRTGTSSFIALSSVCTHAGCTVSFDSSHSRFDCPCHGSEFSESGSVLRGPARTALKKYSCSYS